MSDRHTSLRTLLRSLHLPTMAETFDAVALKAARAGVSHAAFLEELARLEAEERERKRVARRLQESHLPREKTFRTLELGHFPPLVRQQVERLRTGEFVGQAMNVVVVGKPGAGKSHLSAALGHALIDAGHTVRWYPTAALVQHLLAAKRDLRLPQELTKLHRIACLILDDIGYVQQTRDEMEVLFTLLADRYEARSVIISTNLVFSEWTHIFKDPLTTMAAIDRVVHHAVILDVMEVESYRAKVAHARQQQAGQGGTAQQDKATTGEDVG